MWLIIGLVTGVGVLALMLWLRSRNMTVKWYEWLIGALGLVLLLYTVQNVVNLLTEIEPAASGMFALVIGLPAIILLAIAWQLIARRQRSAG